MCRKAKDANATFVDYTKRGPPAFDLLEKYQKISKNEKSGRTDKALAILRKVPALAGLFSQEYKIVSKFCMME